MSTESKIAMTALREATEQDGLLYEGTKVSATDLRGKYRAWRRLITDLKARGAANRTVRMKAQHVLHELRVSMGKEGRALYFCFTGERIINDEWQTPDGEEVTSAETDAALREAIEPGGRLYEETKVSATELRDKYRAWRRLITDLKARGDANKLVRMKAQHVLQGLGVVMSKEGRTLYFGLTGEH